MATLPVVIYSTYDVPRLRYIAGLILGDILGLSWDVVTDKRKIGKHPVINYSSEIIRNAVNISPVPLLFEKEIREQEVNVTRWNGLPVFFSDDPSSDIPFDIFAASFFLVTRYEEYLYFEPDEYGRFKASSSVAFRNGFLQVPVIDLWIKELTKVLLKKFQTLTFKRNKYRSVLAIDADHPFESQRIGLLIGGLLDFKKKKSTESEYNDHDVFQYLLEKIKHKGLDTRFFFCVGKSSKYDHNPSWKNERYRTLISNIAGKYETGLHPSFKAASDYSLMSGEISRLRKILTHDVTSSLLHYVKLSFPHSYRDLFRAGIKSEYSMGYPDEPGFRAGIARPFCFYDVDTDVATGLKIIPFQYSDNSFNNFSATQIIDVIIKLIRETKNAGGLFVSSWHISSLNGKAKMNERREVFEFMLKNLT